jgi:hypothetical protein
MPMLAPQEEEAPQRRKQPRSPQPCHRGSGRSRRHVQQSGRRVWHLPPAGQPDNARPMGG